MTCFTNCVYPVFDNKKNTHGLRKKKQTSHTHKKGLQLQTNKRAMKIPADPARGVWSIPEFPSTKKCILQSRVKVLPVPSYGGGALLIPKLQCSESTNRNLIWSPVSDDWDRCAQPTTTTAPAEAAPAKAAPAKAAAEAAKGVKTSIKKTLGKVQPVGQVWPLQTARNCKWNGTLLADSGGMYLRARTSQSLPHKQPPPPVVPEDACWWCISPIAGPHYPQHTRHESNIIPKKRALVYA